MLERLLGRWRRWKATRELERRSLELRRRRVEVQDRVFRQVLELAERQRLEGFPGPRPVELGPPANDPGTRAVQLSR